MGAQFRSRFVFRMLFTFDPSVELEWHYMEAHHGRGPIDNVGGTIKKPRYFRRSNLKDYQSLLQKNFLNLHKNLCLQ